MLYINKLEGFKAAIKNIHWSSKKMPEHEYMDDLEDLVSDHQDYVAEITQGIFGKIKNNELKAVHYTIKTPQKLMKDMLKAAENFYATIQKSKKFIGLRSVMEDYMAKLNQGVYMLDMTLIESIVNKNFNLIKENKDMKQNKKVVRLTESKLKEMIVEAVQETLNEYGETPLGRYQIGRAIARRQAMGGTDHAKEMADHFTKQRGEKYKNRYDDYWDFDDEAMERGFADQDDFQSLVTNDRKEDASSAAQKINKRAAKYDAQNPKNLEAQKRAQQQAMRQKFKLSNYA